MLIALDEFVERVKAGLPIPASHVVDTSLFERAVAGVFFHENHLVIHKHVFPDNRSECILINPETFEKRVIRLSRLYGSIYSWEERTMIGLLEKENDTEVYKLDTESPGISYDKGSSIIHINPQGTYIVSRVAGNHLRVRSLHARGSAALLDREISSETCCIFYNKRLNRLVCIL